MTPNPQSVSPNDHLTDAAELMQKLNCGLVPVVENGHVKGLITDRDIVVRAIARHKNPEKEKVSKFMTDNVECCSEDDDVFEAVKAMEKHQIRRIPIVNKNQKLVGIVALGDLAARNHDQRLCGEILEQVSQTKKAAAA